MKKQYRRKIAIMICAMVVIFAGIAGYGLRFCSNYIKKQLLLGNQSDAVDIATIIGNNFSITDTDVEYLKTLSFNEMETDDLNRQLMDTVSGLALNDRISNIYVMALLNDDEVKYIVDESNTDELGYKAGTVLNGVWLLNGKFDEDGNFQIEQRDDIYRYLEFCKSDKEIFDNRQSFGLVTEDQWGKFITGYVPFYSKEGNYIGILGVDMYMNIYNDNVANMTTTIFSVFTGITLTLILLFLFFFIKYMKTKEGVLYYEFYSRLSHDMRTPMNGILGIADLSKGERDPDVLQENIYKMEKSGKYLLALVNDTLDFQKMQSGKLTLHKEVVDSKDLVNDIQNMILETAKKKKIHFETVLDISEDEEYILADGMRLKQIFVNLLSNAVKFTPDGGNVKWTIKVQSRDEKIAHGMLEIEDTGIGMSEKFIKNELFKPFAQEYSETTTKYAGTGLGLSIVKNLVEQMGGRIEVESEQGEGTTFRVYLDFETVGKSEAMKILQSHVIKKEESAEILRGKHILLAEDHPLNAEIAKRLLEKYDCIVTWMDDGKKAVDAFETSDIGEFDAILMDIRMPVMDGLEAAKHIRQLNREDAKKIPIIAMTANAYEEDVKKSHEAGMNEHLAKPIDSKVLYAELEKALDNPKHK